MIGKAQQKMLIIVLPLIFLGLGLAACGGVNENETPPVVSDSGGEINVTPQPTKQNTTKVHFTVRINRVGSQMKVGWWAKGEVYIYATIPTGGELVDLEKLPEVSGTGFGMAGYDASGGPCINQGGWPVTYEAGGYFNPETCEFSIGIIETWPKTEGYAVCFGVEGSGGGPEYQTVFTGIKFTEQDVQPSIPPLTKDKIVWLNTFTLIPGVGAENLDCMFADPPAEESGTEN